MDVNYIRQRKRELGLTNMEVAERSGVSLGTVNKIMSGAVKSPRYDTLEAIWDALLIRQDEVIGSTHVSDRMVSDSTYEYGSSAHRQTFYTIRDYYELPDDRRVELIDGLFYDMGAPTIAHQNVIVEVMFQIKSYIKEKAGGCKVLTAPVDVRLNQDDRTMLQPDLMIICDKEKMNGNRYISGAPDWVMEVVSPATKQKDCIIKLNKYLFAGVKEYWIVDINKQCVVVYSQMEGDLDMMRYSFEEAVPVGIYEDLAIDFKELDLLL